MLRYREVECFKAGFGDVRMKSFFFKIMPDQLGDILFVFDDENFLGTLRNHGTTFVRAHISYATIRLLCYRSVKWLEISEGEFAAETVFQGIDSFKRRV